LGRKLILLYVEPAGGLQMEIPHPRAPGADSRWGLGSETLEAENKCACELHTVYKYEKINAEVFGCIIVHRGQVGGTLPII